MNRAAALSALLWLGLTSGLASAQEEAPEEPPITKLPKLLNRAEALYPKAALQERVEASVLMELDISETGTVSEVAVVSSSTVAEDPELVASSTVSDYGFESAALEAAKGLRFEPAEAGGKPIAVRIQYTYRFKLPPIVTPPPTTSSTAAQEAGPKVMNFTGIFRQRGTRKRISGIVVTAFQVNEGESAGFEAVTDQEGVFRFFNLAPGDWKVLAESEGYYPFRTTETIKAGQLTEVTYYIERGSYSPYEVVVEAKRVKKEVNRRTLSTAEIVKVPGTLGDPVLVITNLPGVARPAPGSGQLIVRGSGPNNTGVFIDAVEVPQIYHFGGLRSVIPAEVVKNIDFFPGNFSTFYGRKLGGVFDAKIKTLEPDQVHGVIDVSLLDAHLYLEVPLGDTAAVAISGRRSYVDVILNAAIPDDSNVNLIAAPRYYDYQVMANWRPDPAHTLRMFFFGSNDAIELLFDNPANLDSQLRSGNVEASTLFNRLSLFYDYRPSKTFSNRAQISVGQDTFDTSAFDLFTFKLNFENLQARNNARWVLSEKLALSAGVDMQFFLTDVDIVAPPLPREGDAGQAQDITDVRVARLNNIFGAEGGVYLEAEIGFVPRLLVVPGIRLDYFESVNSFGVDPRVVARYSINEQWLIKGGVGMVHQAPQPAETSEDFGNPDLGLTRVVQSSVGVEYSPLKYLSFDATVFYNHLFDQVSRSNRINADGQPEVFDNGGVGRVYGLELFISHKFNNNFSGWLSYTLSRAERRDSGVDDFRLFSFDQTHILNLVASYTFPQNWEVGVRWRLVSGNPTTPVIGSTFLSDLDRYAQLNGPVNSARLPMFHQLDLRIEKTWIFDWWKISAYLSILNTYNRTNTENINYNFDFSESAPVSGLPILPILGLRGEL